MITQVDRKPFIIEYLANEDTVFAVMRPNQKTWDVDGFQLLDSYYLTGAFNSGKNLVQNMTLNYGCDNSSIVNWG